MTVEVRLAVAAPPEVVWTLVSDLDRMGEWSPETHGVEWLDGASGPAVGARFRGRNRNGSRSWATVCTITVLDPPREIAWSVSARGLDVSRWSYRVEPDGAGGSVLTETTQDVRGSVMRRLAPFATGVRDRAAHNERTMTETLQRIKRAAESPAS